jgi:hypothetical protein
MRISRGGGQDLASDPFQETEKSNVMCGIQLRTGIIDQEYGRSSISLREKGRLTNLQGTGHHLSLTS